eukprot:gene27078-7332_t
MLDSLTLTRRNGAGLLCAELDRRYTFSAPGECCGTVLQCRVGATCWHRPPRPLNGGVGTIRIAAQRHITNNNHCCDYNRHSTSTAASTQSATGPTTATTAAFNAVLACADPNAGKGMVFALCCSPARNHAVHAAPPRSRRSTTAPRPAIMRHTPRHHADPPRPANMATMVWGHGDHLARRPATAACRPSLQPGAK